MDSSGSKNGGRAYCRKISNNSSVSNPEVVAGCSKNGARKEDNVCFLNYIKRYRKKSGGLGRRSGWWKKWWLFSKSSSSSSSFPSRIVDDILFKILSVFEGVVLVSAVCFFFLCCGCQF